jgi:hypothetical protein
MKKLIQIALVVILVLVLFQAIAPAAMVSASQSGSIVVQGIYFTANESVDDVHVATCRQLNKRAPCVKPLVGWNS